MIRDLNPASGAIAAECHLIYDYLRHQAANLSPPELIREFQQLFGQGKNENSRITQALAEIVADKEQFERFLNCCCYIIFDSWADSGSTLYAQLLDTLDTAGVKSQDRRRQKLFKLIDLYRESESYLQLKAVATIISPQNRLKSNATPSTNEASGGSNDKHSSQIEAYLSRYTYLYPHFLPQLELPHLTTLIDRLQHERQQQFEIQLSQHLIYRLRLKQLAKMKLLAKGAGKLITPVPNPSILSERAFKIAWQQYTGKQRGTVGERARHFITENKLRNSYKIFKQDLYRFLTSKIVPRNNIYKFKARLEEKLASIFTQSDSKPLNRSLILQTCRQLYSFLIVELTLEELTANLGTAQVMMVLTKIVLICPESKSDLERKICSLVARYQLQNAREFPWLIKSLEHLLIAFSVHYGKIDVPDVKSVAKQP